MMNAKKLMLSALVALTGTAVLAETPQEDGGVIERREAVPSKQVAVVNAQKIVAADAVDELIRNARFVSDVPFLKDAPKAPITVELVDTPDKSAMVLQPEEFAAKVNVRALAADGAAATTVVARVEKELIRAGFYLMGSGYGPNGCLTAPVSTVKDLDAMALEQPSIEALTHIRGGRRNGVRLIRWTTYREACKKGWAPPPVTPEQKIVWDEFHTKPTEPARIKFDAKKGE